MQQMMSNPFLHLGLGILAGGAGSYGSFGQQLGQGALAGILSYQQALQARRQEQEYQMKLAQAQQQQAQAQRQQAYMQQAISGLPPQQQALARAFPAQWAKRQFDSGSSKWQDYQRAVGQGFTGSFMDYQSALQQAGRPTTDITVSPVIQGAGKSIAGQVGPMLRESQLAAEGAVDQYRAARNVIDALESGDVYTGPFAGFQQRFAQAANKAGWASGDMQTSLNNTRRVIQGLAEFTLQSRSMLAGQGNITEGEQATLEKARSGAFDDMTASEIKIVAEKALDFSQRLHKKHQRNLTRAKRLEGVSEIAPMFEIPDLESGDYVDPEVLIEIFRDK